ncbi:pollen allergen Lol p 2-A-like [Triticum dicoccoides]|uniref:pollen allergen Lol p 2-A-like n=1 Tax=Triticum dicoccoides TaxID=85692 RepID=UPI0018902645|nr:pollen allergen Lol p 2-A-like [Triticum dicoccoides]
MASLSSISVLALAIMMVLVAGARCSSTGKVGFALAKGSTPTNLIVAAKSFGGTSNDFSKMQVKGQGSDKWIDMSNAGSSGKGNSVWKAVSSAPLKAPLAIRYQTKQGTTVVNDDIIHSF